MMIVGILSDTHDDVAAMRAGLAALKAAGAEFYIHCGDLGDEAILDQLVGLPHAAVWGNNDFDRQRLGNYAEKIGVHIHHPAARLELAGKQIVATHGDNPMLLKSVLRENTVNYLMFGHTHHTLDERHGNVRAINPGALYRAKPKTVATLDLATDTLKFIEVTI